MEQKLQVLMSELFRIDKEEVIDSLTMKDTDVWDSLKHMELVLLIEQTMGVDLTFEEIVAMQTFSDIKRILVARGVGGQDGFEG